MSGNERILFAIPVILLLWVLLSPLGGHAQEGPLLRGPKVAEGEQGRGRIEADRLEFLEKGRIIEASGNVYISYGQLWMRADRVRYDRETEEALAEGRVFLTDGKSRLEGVRLEYNAGTGQGILHQGNGFLSPSLWVSGLEIRREDENTYRLSHATLTPCPSEEGGSPDWQVRAKEATIYLNESAIAKGASFWVKRIPLLYSPLLIGPAGERQSGFLIPQPGYSSKEGFILKASYFWAINPSQDATFSLNYRTKRGLEEGIEYRYILSQDTRGHFHGTYTYDEYDETNRWKITYRHQQDFTPQLAGKLNLNIQNTSNYQRIYSPDTEVRSQRLLISEGYLAQHWNWESLMLWGRYDKDLRFHDHLYRLPELDLLSFRQLGQVIPLNFRLQSSAAYFESLWRRDLGRLDLYPRLTLPISLGGFATLTPLAAFRETYYTREREEHEPFSREIYHLQARLDSHLSRTFRVGGGTLDGIQHVIEPMVAYEYIPEVDQATLARYDILDFISPQNGLTYSLTNRLWAKLKDEEGSHFREILTLRLSQSYNIHGPHQEYPYPDLGIAYNEMRDALGLRYSQRRFSDINGQLILRPVAFLNLAVDANYDPTENHIDTIDPTLRLQPPLPLSVEAGYHYAPELRIHAFDGRLNLKLKEIASFGYYTRYDFGRQTFLENRFDVTFFGSCWSFTVVYIVRPGEQDIRFSFDLRSISGVR